MSLDFYFFVETRRNGEWIVPEPFLAKGAAGREVQELLRVRWSSSFGWGFFFSTDAFFPVRVGPPEWTPASALFRWLSDHGVMDDPPERLRWLPYEELLVDTWDESWITVGNQVPAALAPLFGDGSQRFPEAALMAAGWDEHRIHRFREGRPAAPVGRVAGPGRHEVETSHPEAPLTVTWRDTVTGCMTAERTAAFRALRQFGPDPDLRIVATHF